MSDTVAALPTIIAPRTSTSTLALATGGESSTAEAIRRGLKALAVPPLSRAGQVDREPTSLEERLYDTLAAFKIRTAAVAMYLDSDWRSKLFKQLDSLLSLEDWEMNDLPPSLKSYSTFLKMITFIRPSRRPGLGATHDGQMIATWTVGDNRLTVELLADDQVRWALSQNGEEGRESAAGKTSVARIAEVLAPYDPQKWFDSKYTAPPEASADAHQTGG